MISMIDKHFSYLVQLSVDGPSTPVFWPGQQPTAPDPTAAPAEQPASSSPWPPLILHDKGGGQIRLYYIYFVAPTEKCGV